MKIGGTNITSIKIGNTPITKVIKNEIIYYDRSFILELTITTPNTEITLPLANEERNIDHLLSFEEGDADYKAFPENSINFIHGSVIHNGYIYGCSRGLGYEVSGAIDFSHLIKINVADYTDYEVFKFKYLGEDDETTIIQEFEQVAVCGDFIYMQGVAVISPSTPTFVNVIIQFNTSNDTYKIFQFDSSFGSFYIVYNTYGSFQGLPILGADSIYLYFITSGGSSTIDGGYVLKFLESDFQNPSFGKFNTNLPSGVDITPVATFCHRQMQVSLATCHSSKIDDDFIYLIFNSSQGSSNFLKINKSDLSLVGSLIIPKTSDDTAQNDDYVFGVTEIYSGVGMHPFTKSYPVWGDGLWAVKKSDLTFTVLPRASASESDGYGVYIYNGLLYLLSIDNKIYVMDISHPELWSNSKSLEPFILYTISPDYPDATLPFSVNELLLDENGYFHGFIWSNPTSICRFLSSGYSSNYSYNFTVDYGDNSGLKTVTSYNDPNCTHNYTTAGIYQLSITGICESFYINGDLVLAPLITNVISWGDIKLKYVNFFNCVNLSSIPSDSIAGLSLIKSFYNSFGDSGLTSIPIDLFDNATLAESFRDAFMRCLSLSSSVPDLWNDFPNATKKHCFLLDESISNFNDIPILWGGITKITSAYVGTTGRIETKKVYLILDSDIYDNVVDLKLAFYLAGKTIYSVNLSGKILIITVTVAYASGDIISLNYTKPGSNPIKSLLGDGELPSFVGLSVTNNILPEGALSVGTSSSDFLTLKEAFDFINEGYFSEDIILIIMGNTIEYDTAILNPSGGVNYTSVTIYPFFTGLIISGNIDGDLIQFNETENVHIDGRIKQLGDDSLTIENTNIEEGSSTLHYIGVTNTDVLHCNIVGNIITE